MNASVVFATHDRADRLAALLATLRDQTADGFEVVVVDDGSADGTPEVLAREQALGALDLRVIRHETPEGPARARNAGWRAARGALVAFTDDDCVAAPGWVAAGLEAWSGAEGRFVQGRTLPIPEEAHRIGPFTRTLRIESKGPWYQTCNVFYPRAMLQRVGGFDETFVRPAAEDADLAWRCMESGAEPVFAPDALAFHAVHELGVMGSLRLAARWSEVVGLIARHPERRDVLTYRLFWKKPHYLLFRAALGMLLPRRLRPLRFWFYAPIAPAYLHRARSEGGNGWLAPYFIVHDLVEVWAMLRGTVRYRTPVL